MQFETQQAYQGFLVEPLSANDPKPLHLQYVDNFASIGVCESSANEALEHVKGLLELPAWAACA